MKKIIAKKDWKDIFFRLANLKAFVFFFSPFFRFYAPSNVSVFINGVIFIQRSKFQVSFNQVDAI